MARLPCAEVAWLGRAMAGRQPAAAMAACCQPHPRLPRAPCRVCIDSEQRATHTVQGYRPRLLASRPAPSSRIPAEPGEEEAGAAQQP